MDFCGRAARKKNKKKDIVPLMNEKGYRTLKGKLWTYQTLLLEQRRRYGTRVPKIKDPDKRVDGEMKHPERFVLLKGGSNKTKKKKSPSITDTKRADGALQGNGKEDVRRAKPTHVNRSEAQRYKEELEIAIDLDHLERSVRDALDANHSMEEIANVLRRLGALDHKGRPWSAVSLNHHMSEHWMKSTEEQSPFSGEIEIRGGLVDFIDREQKKLRKQKAVNPAPNIEDAWRLIQSEIKKGTKKKAIVGLLNMGGFTTRRGKPWTYQNLLQECQKRSLTKAEQQLESKVDPVAMHQGDRFAELKLRSADFEGDGLAGARSWIQAVLLPKLRQANCKTRSGRDWNYELLLWELLRRDLDLEKLLSNGLDHWWAPKTEDKKEQLESLNLFEILE